MTADRRDFLVAAAAGALAAVGGGVRAATLPLPEYDRLDATALAGEIRAGRITALEALEAAIARAEARSALNAIAERNFDRARAVAREISGLGRAVREQRAKSARLLGVPFALKDLGIAMKGTVTTNGCAFFRDAVAEVDSTLVQRHRAAGLNIFAKTTSPEFGQTATTESKLFGLTRNPWNLEHSTGGSSGGAAAVVAAGILPIAHATDGGGSIRIPASACGVFGLKTSRGRVPAGPAVIESSLGLSVHHAVSRSVRDSALLLQLTQGPEAGSRVGPPASTAPDALARPPRRLRIALLEDNLLGHHVEPAPRPLLQPQVVADMFAGLGLATATGMLLAVKAREKALGRSAREDEFEPINWRALQGARGFTAEQALAARAGFDQAGRHFDLFFAEVDMLLSPTTAVPSPRLGVLSLDQPYEDYVKAAIQTSAFTLMFNISGHPAMSVPLHWNAAGLPVGVQFAAAYGAEARLFALAAQLERAAPWADRRPAL